MPPKNLEKRREYQRKYYEEHAQELRQFYKKYHRKYRVTKFAGYGGVCICPRCGEKGYKHYQRGINIKTGTKYSIHTGVIHKHYENGVMMYDGYCYIGVGKL